MSVNTLPIKSHPVTNAINLKTKVSFILLPPNQKKNLTITSPRANPKPIEKAMKQNSGKFISDNSLSSSIFPPIDHKMENYCCTDSNHKACQDSADNNLNCNFFGVGSRSDYKLAEKPDNCNCPTYKHSPEIDNTAGHKFHLNDSNRSLKHLRRFADIWQQKKLQILKILPLKRLFYSSLFYTSPGSNLEVLNCEAIA